MEIDLVEVKKHLTGIVAVFLFYLLQSSVFRGFALHGTVPNLLLILVCSYGYLRGERSAMWTGFFCGLLLDIFTMDVLGMYALIFVYVGFLAGQTHSRFETLEFRIPLAAVLIGESLVCLAEYLFFYLLYGELDFPAYLKSHMLPELVATLLLAIPVYPFLLWLEERFVKVDPDERKKQEAWNVADLAEADRNSGNDL